MIDGSSAVLTAVIDDAGVLRACLFLGEPFLIDYLLNSISKL